MQFPSLRDTEEAAAAGDEEAIRDLPEKRERISRLEERMNRFWSNHLHSLDQLPELEGESLEFTWDLETRVGEEKEDFQIIRIGDRRIWRELAFSDNILRFNEIKGLLKQKYYGVKVTDMSERGVRAIGFPGESDGKSKGRVSHQSG